MKNQIRQLKEVQADYQELTNVGFDRLSVFDPDAGFGRLHAV